MNDSYRAIFADAARKVADAARKVADAVKPHATLDNAIKVATVVELAARTASTIANLPKPPPVGPLGRRR